jgi:hypothetical protein
MPNAKTGNSTTIQIGATTIGDVVSIGGVSIATDAIEVTTLASTMKEFIPGLQDAGEVTIGVNFYTGDAGQLALKTAALAKTTDTYIITFPSTIGATWTFSGFITAYGTGEINNEVVSAEITVKITGSPTLGLTTSGGLTALSLTAAGGTLVPSFSASLRSYVFSGVSASSVTVTPTAASHTIKLYIDDVYSQDITSGAASSSISLTINVSKRLTLICYEAAKTPITYNIVVVKTA